LLPATTLARAKFWRIATSSAICGWLSAGVSAQAAVLLSDNFDSAQPGAAYVGAVSGSGFGVTSGNIDVIGSIQNDAGAGYFTCPGGGPNVNNCLDLNGDVPGTIQSNSQLSLKAGITYRLAFDVAGSSSNSGNTPYSLSVRLGDSAASLYSVAPNTSFTRQFFSFTPTVDENAARLVFTSTSTQTPSFYGPLLDNISLTDNISVLRDATQPEQHVGDILLQENFDAARPSGNYNRAIASTVFDATSGNVDILGDITNGGPSGFYSCPVPSTIKNNCLDLNGDQPGAVTSADPLNLLAGTSYTFSFDIAGNVADGSPAPYQALVTLGTSFTYTFNAPVGSPFQHVSFVYQPIVDEPAAALVISSGGDRGAGILGPMIDNIEVVVGGRDLGLGPQYNSLDIGVDVPEPSSLGLLAVGGFALIRVGRRR
jgi:hypothetical protein